MDEEREPQAADHVKAHPLAEKLVWSLPLRNVKVVVEGVDGDGNIIRVRSAGEVEFHKPSNLAIVEVQPLERTNSILQFSEPAEHHIVVVGQLMPGAEGDVYVVEHLKERTL